MVILVCEFYCELIILCWNAKSAFLPFLHARYFIFGIFFTKSDSESYSAIQLQLNDLKFVIHTDLTGQPGYK